MVGTKPSIDLVKDRSKLSECKVRISARKREVNLSVISIEVKLQRGFGKQIT